MCYPISSPPEAGSAVILDDRDSFFGDQVNIRVIPIKLHLRGLVLRVRAG